MDNLVTTINWILNDFCKSECEYCPISLRGGAEPPETKNYLRVIDSLIASYQTTQNRYIKWVLNGGEPLDIDDIAMLLKACKTERSSITLHTNGGRLWVDWWAIEPYVDHLNLTFHYWQNPALIKYITQTFKNKNKNFKITAPIRHNHFKEDLDRVLELEDSIELLVQKTLLYKESDPSAGMYDYKITDLKSLDFYNNSKEQREKILERERLQAIEALKTKPPSQPAPPTPSVQQKIYFQETTWDDRYKATYESQPVYAGQLCNAGVEYLNIGAQGWVSGSICNNQPLGNIWRDGWIPPTSPQVCTMISCVHSSDQLITKFPKTT